MYEKSQILQPRHLHNEIISVVLTSLFQYIFSSSFLLYVQLNFFNFPFYLNFYYSLFSSMQQNIEGVAHLFFINKKEKIKRLYNADQTNMKHEIFALL